MGLQQAIEAPMFHSDHFPSSFFPRASAPGEMTVEGRLARGTIDDLVARGHRVAIGNDWSLGRLSAVAADGDPLPLRAASNPRGAQGYAVGR
jgi:gamma-glutamyltranspeptidase/glutathione hydrolase